QPAADVGVELALPGHTRVVPDREELVALGAGRGEDVARDTAVLRHALDLGEREAHRLRVEAVRLLDVLHREREMVEAHRQSSRSTTVAYEPVTGVCPVQTAQCRELVTRSLGDAVGDGRGFPTTAGQCDTPIRGDGQKGGPTKSTGSRRRPRRRSNATGGISVSTQRTGFRPFLATIAIALLCLVAIAFSAPARASTRSSSLALSPNSTRLFNVNFEANSVTVFAVRNGG